MRLWTNIAQYLTEALAVVLIVRLLLLQNRANSVYSVFVAFLGAQVTGTLAFFACQRWPQLDYRLIYFGYTVVISLLSLWLVYALSKAVLSELPGILRISRFLLNIVFLLAILLAFSTSRAEYFLTPARSLNEQLDRLIYAFIVIDKGISMAAVVILIVILAFILWFPVKMSKNLAIFSVGLVVYFASKTGLKIVSIYLQTNAVTRQQFDLSFTLLVIFCFFYWIAFMDAKGHTREVRMGHGWQRDDQEKLIAQLESLNGALMRSSDQLRRTEDQRR